MKIIVTVCLLFFITILNAQVKLLSWNIDNLYKSKSDAEILYIDEAAKSYDIIALQEVVAGYGGAQAVAEIIRGIKS